MNNNRPDNNPNKSREQKDNQEKFGRGSTGGQQQKNPRRDRDDDIDNRNS